MAEAAGEASYSGEEMSGLRIPTAHLILPGRLKLPLTVHDRIATGNLAQNRDFQVRVAGDCQITVVRITGSVSSNIRHGMKSFIDLVQDFRAKQASGRQVLLLQPPESDISYRVVVPASEDTMSSRPTLRILDQGKVRGVESLDSIDHYKHGLCRTLEQWVKRLDSGCRGVMMQVNFGYLDLCQRQGPVEYKPHEFADMIEKLSVRGGAKLSCCVGDSGNAPAILDRLVSRLCTRNNSTQSQHLDTSHLICLVGHDARIELDVLSSGAGNGSALYLSTPRTYGRDWKRFQITSAAPHRKFDWNMEIVAKESLDVLPEWRTVIDNITVLAKPDTAGFPAGVALLLDADPKMRSSIQETCLTTSVTLPYSDTQYQIEVSVAETWAGTDVSTEPATVCAVRVRSPQWNAEPHTTFGDSNIGRFFARNAESTEELTELMNLVLKLQETLS